MSITEVIRTGLSGLNASQAGLRAVSNNLANVQTPGYARQRVGFTPNVLGGRVVGVKADTLERMADRFLEMASFQAAGDVGRLETIEKHLKLLQTQLGQPGASTSLAAKFDRIKAAAVEMTSPSVGPTAIRAFVNSLESALADMKDLSSSIERTRNDAAGEIGSTVDQINGLIERLAGYNDEIARARTSGRSTAGYEDQRTAALEELGKLVQLRTVEQADGRLFLETASGVALLDRQPRSLNSTDKGIEVSFLDRTSRTTTLTGETLDATATGGKLGALIDLRDRIVPDVGNNLGHLFASFAGAINAVHNLNVSSPPPNTLQGRATGLVGTDLGHFTGAATFAVTDASGKLVASTNVDFDALGPGATIDDVVAAINAGLGGAGTASFADGRLTLRATAGANGISVADDPARPATRSGLGFAQAFGLNDLIQTTAPILPAGLASADQHGFPNGQSMDLALRDANGRIVARYTLSPAAGGTVGDLITSLNGSPLGALASFSLDNTGRLKLTPNGNNAISLDVMSDGTARTGTGARLSDMLNMGQGFDAAALANAKVRSDIAQTPTRLSIARLDTTVAVGAIAVAAGDSRGAAAFVDGLSGKTSIPGWGSVSLDERSADFIASASAEAIRAAQGREDATARLTDIDQRRDQVAGVSIDEELSQMVLYQNSYSAAARLITAANQMYEELLGLAR